MGEAQGKKVDPLALRHKAIEAQPAFGQIKPSEAAWRWSSAEEKKWPMLSGPGKRPIHRSEAKEPRVQMGAPRVCVRPR
jgi:hypothetical protein